jgi:hypothetical protein
MYSALSLTPIVKLSFLGFGLGFAFAFGVEWLVALYVGDWVGAGARDAPPVEGAAGAAGVDALDASEAADAVDDVELLVGVYEPDEFEAAATPAANPPPELLAEAPPDEGFCGTVAVDDPEPAVVR